MNQLSQLTAELKQAKQIEAKANENRLAIEAQIVALFPPQTGEATVKQDDLTITYKTVRSVATEQLQEKWMSLSANSQKAFTWKAGIDLKQFRAIKDLDPQAFKEIEVFVTSKPSKPTVSVKE